MKELTGEGSDRHTYVPNCTFSHRAGSYEDNTGIKNDDADLHRQVDAKDFVFASRKALSTRGIAPPSPRGLTADAYQISTQPRIFRIDRQERDQLKTSCCRIFVDPAREDNHRPASQYVPLGQAIPHEGKRWRAPSRNLSRTYPGVVGIRNSCSKNKLNKPGEHYEHRKQDNSDHRLQPWHWPGARRRSTQTRRAKSVCGNSWLTATL